MKEVTKHHTAVQLTAYESAQQFRHSYRPNYNQALLATYRQNLQPQVEILDSCYSLPMRRKLHYLIERICCGWSDSFRFMIFGTRHLVYDNQKPFVIVTNVFLFMIK